MSEKSIRLPQYIIVFTVLLLLTATTCGMSYINLGRLNTFVALAIAVCKALLVALYFMHLRYSHRLISLVVVAALFWLCLMVMFTMGDYLTRPVTTSAV